jgi:hypothetical protein
MLVDLVRDLLDRIAPIWEAAFARHGLNLRAEDTASELARTLKIDWTDPRVADLCRSTYRAIEPGDPARSLLYHMLARPADESSGASVSPEELDLLENYLYSRAGPPDDWQKLEIAVLAYQYRPARRTGHEAHADMVFSRLGIARNGDREARFDPPGRCFSPDAGDAAHVRVLPARFGAFLVRRREGPHALALIEGEQSGDHERSFVTPVYKLFQGSECLPGLAVSLSFVHCHVGDKLKRAVQAQWGVRVPRSVDLDAPPFTMTSSGSAGDSVGLMQSGSAVWVMPRPLLLIEPVQAGALPINGFKVPRQWPWPLGLVNRRYTTMRIVNSLVRLFLALLDEVRQLYAPHFAENWLRYPEPRNAPEYINIRHPAREGDGSVPDMRNQPENRERFLDAVKNGGYETRFFIDHCAEGVVSVALGEQTTLRVLPAYSIVAAPDFYPYADQVELQRWFQQTHTDPKSQFRNGGPSSLSGERLTANPEHDDPLTGKQAFPRTDTTISVAFSLAARTERHTSPAAPDVKMVSFLSDASSNVFAPGWDVTYASDPGGIFLATHGLGSPFAEDVKLCAASNSFWPALSPDASRTFNRADAPTAIPMLDEEIGLHPGHPLVVKGVAAACRGWDGEYGPYLTPDGMAEYADIYRSDYVSNALAGNMLFGALQHVDAAELIRRIRALRHAVAACDQGQTPAHTRLWLISARRVDDRPAAAQTVYRFLFVLPLDPAPEPVQTVPGRLRVRYAQALCCDSTATARLDPVRTATPGDEALALYLHDG